MTLEDEIRDEFGIGNGIIDDDEFNDCDNFEIEPTDEMKRNTEDAEEAEDDDFMFWRWFC